MKFFSTHKKILVSIIAAAMLGVGKNSQAASSFSSQATLGFVVDSIVNANNPGDLSGLSMLVSFNQAGSPTSYVSSTGDGGASAHNPGIAPLPVAVGTPFVNTFSANGSVSDGTVASSHVGWYTLAFNNTSATDDYGINLTIAYDLLANASGEFADSDVILDVYTDSNPSLANVFANASTLASRNAGASGSFPQYAFQIAHGSSLALYADVTINGNLQAAPVPLPAAAWSFLAGLLGVLGLKKRKTRIDNPV